MRLYAGIDLGTTRAKLVVYDDGFNPVYYAARPSPLETGPGRATHDPQSLLQLVHELAAQAGKRGARALGIALYRASPLAWTPPRDPLTPVILWMDWERRLEAVEKLPPPARLLARAPLLSRALSPESPLPLIGLLHRLHPGAHAWTLDSYLAEAHGAGYVTVAGMASVSGAYNPRSLRPLRLTASAAGVDWSRAPRLVGEAMVEGEVAGLPLRALAGDQQAAMIGLGCLEPGCLKISLGTGSFATAIVEGPPPLAPGKGLHSLVVAAEGERIAWAGVEAMIPGVGQMIELLAGIAGGYEPLARLTPGDCRGAPAILVAPEPGPWRLPALLAHPSTSPRDLACGALAGLGVAVGLAARRARSRAGPGRTLAVGGPARIPLLLDAAASTLGEPVEAYPGLEAGARGAAFLAAVGMGDYELGEAGSLLDPGEGVVYEPGDPPVDPGAYGELAHIISSSPGQARRLLGGGLWAGARG